ncbi:MAG: Flp family type IVb pilin [Hyphomicrobium sp.]
MPPFPARSVEVGKRRLKHLCQVFIADESGSHAIEYGLIAALVSVGIATILPSFAGSFEDIMTAIAELFISWATT